MLTGLREPTVLRGCCPEPLDYLANAGYEGNWSGIVTDSCGQPFVQEVGNPQVWPYPGLYLSTTDYLVPNFGKYDARHYLDSEHVLFMVVPDEGSDGSGPRDGSGCRGVVTDLKTGRRCECVVGDIGPSDHPGEGSIALATYFGISGCPKTGGSRIVSAGTIKCGPVKPPRDSRCSSPLKCSPGCPI